MKGLCLSILLILQACHGSKGGTKPIDPPPAAGLTAEQKACIKTELGLKTSLGAFEAVQAYKKCGGPDEARVFAEAVDELLIVQDNSNWSLK